MAHLRIEQEGQPARSLDFDALSQLDGQIADVGTLSAGQAAGMGGQN